MNQKPKPEDFNIGEPVTRYERDAALLEMLNERVILMRQKAYEQALEYWEYLNSYR